MSSTGIDAPTNLNNEDDELQRALAASLQDSSTPQEPQQTGITSAPETLQPSPFFGPTNRNDHNVDEWAMVRASPPPMDCLPSARKREPGQPVFLRCRTLQQIHRLGPFIMLLHSVPTARNFFLLLNQDEDSNTLGSNNGWWRGENIFALTSTKDDPKVSRTDELKRLVAFLDISDRSYGTADPLNYRLSLDNFSEPIIRLFESLYNHVPRGEQSRLWTSVKTDTAGEIVRQDFGVLDFPVDPNTPEARRTLYGLWDRAFWICPDLNSMTGYENTVPSFAYIDKPAKVMTMRITSAGIPIEIPEVLFIDRYLEKNVEKTRSIRDQMAVMWIALGKYTTSVQKLTQVTSKTGRTADNRVVLRRLIQRSRWAIRQVRARALWRNHVQQLITGEPPISYLPAELNHLVDEVQLDEAEQEEVKQLEIEIQQAQARLARIERMVARKSRTWLRTKQR